jgi:transposase
MTLQAIKNMLPESLAETERGNFLESREAAFASITLAESRGKIATRRRLAETEWKRIVKCLPSRMRARARNNENTRRFMEAVLWVASTNLYWKSMPDEYGDPHANYMRFVRWAHAGIWDQVLSAMEDSNESSAHLYRLVDSYRTKSTMMNMTKALPDMDGSARMHSGLDQLQGGVRHADRPQHGYSGNA